MQQVAHRAFLAGAPGDDRGVRRQVDRAREHRHERAVHARLLGARRDDRPRRRTPTGVTPTASALERVNGKIIVDGTTTVQAFEAGEVDASTEADLPPEEIARLKEDAVLRAVPGSRDVLLRLQRQEHHRRERAARALARGQPADRSSTRSTQADQLPATGMTPQGMPGFDTINPNSPWLPAEGDIEQAKECYAQAPDPKTNDQPLRQRLARPQGDRDGRPGRRGSELGIETTIKVQEWAAVPRVPRPAAERRRGRLPARMDRRLSSTRSTSSSCGRATRATTTPNWCNKDYDALVARGPCHS